MIEVDRGEVRTLRDEARSARGYWRRARGRAKKRGENAALIEAYKVIEQNHAHYAEELTRILRRR